MISDHEWQLLILKAKGNSHRIHEDQYSHECVGIRQALSIRIIDCILRYGHMVRTLSIFCESYDVTSLLFSCRNTGFESSISKVVLSGSLENDLKNYISFIVNFLDYQLV